MIVTITKVSPTYPWAVFLQWDVTPNQGVSGNFSFTVWRAGSPAGPFTKIAGPFTNQISYTDAFETKDSTSTEINALSLQRSIYYQVVVTDPTGAQATSAAVNLDGEQAFDGDNKQAKSTPSNLNKRKFLLRRKIIREETVAFKKLNGIELHVLKRMHFGTRCNSCYDPLTRSLSQSRCSTCYGTSWVGGFFTPIITYGRINPSPIQTTITNSGKSETNTTQLNLLNYPKVEEGDVIAEVPSGRRWLVRQVSNTEIKRLTVHQRVLVTELPRGSPEYSVPI